MDFDDLLVNHLGEFGKYQIILYFTLCLVGIPAAFNNMAIVFLAGVPNHWCTTQGLNRFNITDEARWNLTIPLEQKDGEWEFSKCKVYNRSFTGWADEDANMAAQTSLHARNFSQAKCAEGWSYDRSLYESTVVTEWDLVCDLELLQATAASVYMAGLMVGVLLFGQVSDWIGRKWAICICIVFMTGFNIGVAFSPGYIVFFVLRFMVALCTISLFTTGFVFGMEIVGPKWRVFAGFMIEIFWAVGYMAVAGAAYGIRNWRTLQLVLSCPLAVLILYIFVLPESPRWLYAKHKKERADKLVKRIAKVNRKTLPESFEVVVAQEDKRGTFIDLFRTPRLRYRTLNLCFNWFVNSLVYYGLSLNTSNLGGDPYVNFLISGAVEVPAYILCIVLLPLMGRRWPLSGTMVIGGLALLGTLPVPSNLQWLSITLAMVGKFAITMSFGIIYVFTAELLPTVVRNIGVGTGSFWARVGGICAPYIGSLTTFSSYIPPAIFGVLSLAAGLLALLLPETKDKELPETIEDGEAFGLSERQREKMEPGFSDVINKPDTNGVENPGFTKDNTKF